jgi:hypothetical protein
MTMFHKRLLALAAVSIVAGAAMTDAALAAPRGKHRSWQVDPLYGPAQYIHDGFNDVCVVNRKIVYNPYIGEYVVKKFRRCYY